MRRRRAKPRSAAKASAPSAPALAGRPGARQAHAPPVRETLSSVRTPGAPPAPLVVPSQTPVCALHCGRVAGQALLFDAEHSPQMPLGWHAGCDPPHWASLVHDDPQVPEGTLQTSPPVQLNEAEHSPHDPFG